MINLLTPFLSRILNASAIAEEIVSKHYSARRVEFIVKGKKIDKTGKKKYDANIFNMQEKIEKILGMRVSITNKKNNSGKISIEYKDLEQFDFISKLLTKR